MARSFNKATVLGNITRDPDVRSTSSGQKVTTISVAVNRNWTDATGEKKEQTDYFDIVLWGKLAEVAENYLKKGSKVLVEGRLQNRSWDANDGSKRIKTEIIASELVMLDRATGSNEYSDNNEADESAIVDNLASVDLEGPINLDDAIPF